MSRPAPRRALAAARPLWAAHEGAGYLDSMTNV